VDNPRRPWPDHEAGRKEPEVENKIILHVVPLQVVVEYLSGSLEGEPMDRLRSMEFGLHALTCEVIRLRRELKIPVPDVYAALQEAHAHREVM
jgi:hypothetical protein